MRADPMDERQQVGDAHAIVAIIVHVPEETRVAAAPAQRAEEAEQVVQVHVAVAVAVAIEPEERVHLVAAAVAVTIAVEFAANLVADVVAANGQRNGVSRWCIPKRWDSWRG